MVALTDLTMNYTPRHMIAITLCVFGCLLVGIATIIFNKTRKSQTKLSTALVLRIGSVTARIGMLMLAIP